MVKNSQDYNIGYREYNWMEAITEEFIVGAGDTSVSLKTIVERLKQNESYGILVRMQRTEVYLAANPTHLRKTTTLKKILNRPAMGTAHLTFKVGGSPIFENVPLEILGFDVETHAPGTYAQFILPENIEWTNSKITLDGTLVTAEEAIEITFIPAIERCVIKKKC